MSTYFETSFSKKGILSQVKLRLSNLCYEHDSGSSSSSSEAKLQGAEAFVPTVDGIYFANIYLPIFNDF